jgi:alkylhydroperoxidase/carboxymuconolactone decarboxylase family protein YurZ
MLAELMQRNSEPEQESLLKLYWNRAGVKRELVNLKREHFELLEKLEQQEGAILRAQSQLEGLERLLTNPLAAANAMVYFQLRHLWRVGALKVQQFGKELKSQREKRERMQLHSAVMAKRNRRLQAIKEKMDDLLRKRKHAIEEVLRLEQRLERMNFLVKFVAGPRMRNRAQGMKQNREALEERIEEFNEIIEKIQGEPLPEPDGLSLESRRLINVAIIALSQHLVVHFVEHDLARLAKKATKRTVADMKFGDRMVERVREKVEALNGDKQLADRVKRRTDMLLNKVQYRHETDATPMQSGVAEIVVSPEREMEGHSGEPPLRVNVLEDDYWDLSQVLF